MAGYEVFISFKNTDENKRTTRDCQMAESLYYALKRQGIRAFFSNISIKESGESSYRQAIDKALDESIVMVVVCTRKEYMQAPQIAEEIEQFRNDMLNGNKPIGKTRLFTYLTENIDPNTLPNGLRHYQSCFAEQDLVVRISNFLKEGSKFQNIGQTDVLYQGYADQAAPVLPKQKQITGGLLKPGTLIDGKYRIVNLVGRGGMSEVYLAVNEKSNKITAVKIIRTDGNIDFEAVKMGIKVETDLMRKLDHPSVPKIHEVIDLNDRLYLIMDFVEGTSLNQVITQNGPLNEKQTLDVGRQLADVLDYLHNQSNPVIYRDMKPANIILKPDGKVMLIDFGIAREYKEGNLADTTCLGTRGYAAPEQYGGMGQTDARTDIYCLGVTLYHLVTGKNPTEPPYAILPIRQLNPKLSHGLEHIIKICTQNDPDKRFQSAGELLDAFDNIEKLGNQAWRKELLSSMATKVAEAIPLTDKWVEKKRDARKKAAPVSKAFAIPGASVPQQLQSPQRIESAMHTTVLSPEPPVIRPSQAVKQSPPPVKPREFAIPGAPAPRPIPALAPAPASLSPDFYSAPTELLGSTCVLAEPEPAPVVPVEQPVPEVPPKPKSRKVTVRAKASSNPELDEMVTKLTALDPESQAIVRQLIDRLSQ